MDYLRRYLAEEVAEDYLDRRLTRREFLRRLTLLTGSMGAAIALAASMGCGEETEEPAAATPTDTPSGQPTPTPTTATSTPAPMSTQSAGITVPEDDPSLVAQDVQFPGDGVTLFGYLARPSLEGTYPGVLIIHENRGLLPPHYQDVARRFAKEGYVALAIDLISREGGTARYSDPAELMAALNRISAEQLVADMNAGVRYLQEQQFVRAERIGAIGFCFGGGMVWLLAVRNQDLAAAVPFYGPSPPLDEVPNINAAILGIYAGNDTRINAGMADLEAALMQHGKTYRFITYPGADHAFFNDTGQRHNPEAARAAWSETLAWFDRYLRS